MIAVQVGMWIFAALVVLAGIIAICSAPEPFTNPRRSSMSNAKSTFAIIGAIILALAAIAGLAFYGNGLNYVVNKTFSPLNEQVRHNTFECSASHIDGIAREIRQYQDQYRTADADSRIIIRERVLQEAESQTGDACPLPQDVQLFVQSLR